MSETVENGSTADATAQPEGGHINNVDFLDLSSAKTEEDNEPEESEQKSGDLLFDSPASPEANALAPLEPRFDRTYAQARGDSRLPVGSERESVRTPG